MIYISGPGHGGNAVVSNVYLEGTYSEIYPEITEDTEGLKKLFKQFSFPGRSEEHTSELQSRGHLVCRLLLEKKKKKSKKKITKNHIYY